MHLCPCCHKLPGRLTHILLSKASTGPSCHMTYPGSFGSSLCPSPGHVRSFLCLIPGCWDPPLWRQSLSRGADRSIPPVPASHRTSGASLGVLVTLLLSTMTCDLSNISVLARTHVPRTLPSEWSWTPSVLVSRHSRHLGNTESDFEGINGGQG